MSKRSLLLNLMVAVAALAAILITLASPHEEIEIEHQHWSFAGPFGEFDRAQLRRGFQIYQQVCSACHSLDLLAYRHLEGAGFSAAEVKAIAAAVTVTDGPDDQGEMFERPGKDSDTFKAPFANEQAARAANNGALPPDLSLIARSRAGKGFGAYEGADYIYALMTGYGEAPAGMTISEGMSYNKSFRGHQIAMPQPLSEGSVAYEDGTEATLDQQARDVAAFLAWAGEPSQEARKSLGLKVMMFLIALTLLAYWAKRKVWSKVH